MSRKEKRMMYTLTMILVALTVTLLALNYTFGQTKIILGITFILGFAIIGICGFLSLCVVVAGLEEFLDNKED